MTKTYLIVEVKISDNQYGSEYSGKHTVSSTANIEVDEKSLNMVIGSMGVVLQSIAQAALTKWNNPEQEEEE